MRILHVYKNYLPETRGGVEQTIFHLCEGTRAAGHVADVLVTGPDLRHRLREVEVGRHRVFQARRTAAVLSTPMSVAMMRVLPSLSADYDLLHYHFPWPFGDLLQLRLGTRMPYLVTYHADIVRQRRLSRIYRPLLMERFLAGASRVVATSATYAASSPVLGQLAVPPAIVPIGIPGPVPVPAGATGDSEAVKAVLSVPGRFFLFVGTMRYYKGLETLVRASPHVGSRIVLAGDGPERSRIERLARQVGTGNLQLVGSVSEDDKWRLIDRALGLVLPSHLRAEAFGVSLLEAAALERPMISCSIGTGSSEINVHGETGLVVPPSDPLALGKAMRDLESDPEMASRMGRQAGLRFRERFTADRMVARYLDLYHQATASGDGPTAAVSPGGPRP